MVVALVALIFATSGTALAAHRYLITSTKQISPRVLSHLRGQPGATGPAGAQGPQGASGRAGSTVALVDAIRRDATVAIAPGQSSEATVFCDGTGVGKVVGGGYAGKPDLNVYESHAAVDQGMLDNPNIPPPPPVPLTGGWTAKAKNTGTSTIKLDVIAYCAPR